MKKIMPVMLLATICSCAVLQDNSFIERADYLMKGHHFIYTLPYETGTKHFIAQGYESFFSHHGDYAIDFKMKPGTKVLAAREGIVVYVKQSYTAGGVGKKYVGKGNGITIKHSDSTYAHYWHIRHNGALVKVGDTIKQGQHIAFSGSTGFSAFPHLHFEVSREQTISHGDFPVQFQTAKGVKFLQPLYWYKAL